MANPTIYQRPQVGKQVSFNTPVAATRRLAAIAVALDPQEEVSTFRPNGSRLVTVAGLNKEWCNLPIEDSPVTYNEIVYLLNSLIQDVSPTGNGTSTPYVWTYDLTRDGGQSRALYTVEHGSSARGRDVPDTVVSSLTFRFSRDGVRVTGTMTGNAVVDNQTLTAALNELVLVPVMPTQVGIKFAATQAGLTAASLLTAGFVVELTIANVSAPVFPLNQAAGFSEHVDTLPDVSGTVMLQIDANGMAPLANMRDGSTLFMRVQAQGPVLAGISPTAYNAMEIDTAMKIKGWDPGDHEGVYVATWQFDTAYDPTWTKGLQIKFTNGLASL